MTIVMLADFLTSPVKASAIAKPQLIDSTLQAITFASSSIRSACIQSNVYFRSTLQVKVGILSSLAML
jgi:hypothetical protein